MTTEIKTDNMFSDIPDVPGKFFYQEDFGADEAIVEVISIQKFVTKFAKSQDIDFQAILNEKEFQNMRNELGIIRIDDVQSNVDAKGNDANDEGVNNANLVIPNLVSIEVMNKIIEGENHVDDYHDNVNNGYGYGAELLMDSSDEIVGTIWQYEPNKCNVYLKQLNKQYFHRGYQK